MNRGAPFSASRLAATLVVLAAFFHVQWLAACDLVPMPDHRACCAGDHDGATDRCENEVDADACLVPFAAQAFSLKLAERLQGSDDLPDASPEIVEATGWLLPSGTASPPDPVHDAVIADGRSIYLISGRLRL